jgi:hypothetical protein
MVKVHKGCRTIDSHLYRNAYRVLVGKLIGKRLLGIPKRRWEDNIKMHVGEIELGDIDRINLV